MPRATALYLRVSSRAQDTASQKPDLERWLAALPLPGEVLWYEDTFTGKTMIRPGFQRLLADIASGRIGTVAVWRLDRLGRTARGLTALFEELREKRVNLVSLKDGLDLSTAAGRLMANVLASVAAYETEIRAERVLAGQAVARAKGKRWGGGVQGRRWKVTPLQAETIRRLKAEGVKVAAIARALALARTTVYSVLEEE